MTQMKDTDRESGKKTPLCLPLLSHSFRKRSFGDHLMHYKTFMSVYNATIDNL